MDPGAPLEGGRSSMDGALGCVEASEGPVGAAMRLRVRNARVGPDAEPVLARDET